MSPVPEPAAGSEIYESLADRLVREALERGDFDDNPLAGKPLQGLDHRDEQWWVKGLIERERLKGGDFSEVIAEEKRRRGLG